MEESTVTPITETETPIETTTEVYLYDFDDLLTEMQSIHTEVLELEELSKQVIVNHYDAFKAQTIMFGVLIAILVGALFIRTVFNLVD